MKKRCMAIAKKVMVWSLAASMLVATPLTASATGLNEVYKIEDSGGNVIGNPEHSRTGTVSGTGSRTGVLRNDAKITGIVLDETDVNLTMNDGKKNDKKKLTVKLLTEGTIPDEEMKALNKLFKWSSSDTEVVATENLAKLDPERKTNVMELNAKAGGEATVTVSLDHDEFNIHYTATANVSVKEYATKLEFSKKLMPEITFEADNGDKVTKRNGYVGHSVNLNDALVKTPLTANDEITFAIVNGYDAKTKKNAKNVATLSKTGVLTYKKAGWVQIVAIGERKQSEVLDINIDAGTPANKVEIWLDKAGETRKAAAQKLDVSVNEQRELKVVAKLYAKAAKNPMTEAERNGCTDKVVWESNKPAIVKIQGSGDNVTLIPTGVGKATITAKTSAGKKTTLGVTVSATMTDITIKTKDSNIYSGQTLELQADRYFGEGEKYKNFPGSDGVTWSLVNNSADKKYASIKKNVITIKPSVSDAQSPIKVTVKSAKKYGSPKANVLTTSKPLELTLKQADVSQITVFEGAGGRLAAVGYEKKADNFSKGTVTLNAGNSKTLLVTAYGPDGSTMIPDTNIPLATTLNISVNNDKYVSLVPNKNNGNATVTAKNNKGKATIKVSGTKMNKAATPTKAASYKAITASFKADVKTPAKSIQLAYKAKVVKANLDSKGVTKKQTIKVTATLPKGTTTNAKNIQWKATVNGTPITATIKNGKTGSITLDAGKYNAGDVITVYASVKEGQVAGDKVAVGASSTITIPVVKPSKAVEIWDTETNKPFVNSKDKKNQADLNLTEGDGKVTELNMTAKVKVAGTTGDEFVEPGLNGAADVTYSVNKKGIVTIVDGKIKGVMPGTVKITATSSDNRKATLTVKVAE